MRQAIKRIHNSCTVCKRLQGKPYSPVDVPPLPEFRVQQTEPFQVTGIDYTGAIQVRESPGNITKVYAVLFTCAVTRAIHIELIEDLSSEGFLHALRRFASRNGFPQTILSDNATCFVGASSHLKRLMDDPQVMSTLAGRKCQWKFIPARAPWFGAIWERTIGIVKSALKKVLGRAMVTKRELQTVLMEIEMAVNDRPLTYTSASLDDLLPISPSLLTRGRQLHPFPKSAVTDEDLEDLTFCDADATRRRFQYIDKISGDLWKRWSNEYLLSLRERHSNIIKGTNKRWPQVGDIVLIHEERPRLYWKLGRIVKLFPGIDGHIRVAELQTLTGSTTRPIIKLYPLEQDVDLPENTGVSVNVPPQGNANDGSSPQVGATNTKDCDLPPASSGARPKRRAAMGSADLWRSKISQGDL